MSYLNSILSSITGNDQSSKSATAKPPPRKGATQTGKPRSLANGGDASSGPSLKRKAEGGGSIDRSEPSKMPRNSAPDISVRSGSSISAKPVAKAISAPAAQRPPSSGAAPKKGSFAEIMARAAAAQKTGASKPSVGTIQHKPAEKVSLKDKKARSMRDPGDVRGKKLGLKSTRVSSRHASRSQSPDKGGVTMNEVSKTKKGPSDLAYRGTMRPSAPAEPSYRGTMRSYTEGSRLGPKAGGRSSGYNTHLSYDDGEEDDFDSASDMEAGMDEMYEEEEFSLRHARREDAEAKQEEERLKREKELRTKSFQ